MRVSDGILWDEEKEDTPVEALEGVRERRERERERTAAADKTERRMAAGWGAAQHRVEG